MLLIRCYTTQFDDDYNRTTGEMYTQPGNDEYVDILRRVENGTQKITNNTGLNLHENITVEMTDNGLDSANRSVISINIIISTTGIAFHIFLLTLRRVFKIKVCRYISCPWQLFTYFIRLLMCARYLLICCCLCCSSINDHENQLTS